MSNNFGQLTEQNGHIVSANKVVKSFPVGDDELTILKGISFDIKSGEFVTIVGPSGNGKSTLLNMITGIDHPTAGEVIVTGRQVHEMSENELATWRGEHVGIIFQFFQMLPALSLLQNVILPMDFAHKYSPREREERAMHLLESVSLADQAHKLPGQVSGGQQQRAAVARALANDPPLVVADEPTGNLDSHTSEEVFHLFKELVDQGKTVLMVTHDKELAQQVPRTIEIIDGNITRDESTGDTDD
ncbi:MAG: ABC transporter ATP-binding protein [Candidatus Promineifilaceae bacterium]|nr:ABC transporter ATP-binding protein [Candidatus Promineifilaceae bacterium]